MISDFELKSLPTNKFPRGNAIQNDKLYHVTMDNCRRWLLFLSRFSGLGDFWKEVSDDNSDDRLSPTFKFQIYAEVARTEKQFVLFLGIL